MEFQPIKEPGANPVPELTRTQKEYLISLEYEMLNHIARTAAHRQYREQAGELALRAVIIVGHAISLAVPHISFYNMRRYNNGQQDS